MAGTEEGQVSDGMKTLVLSLSEAAYEQLERRAAQLGKPLEEVSEEILEAALPPETLPGPKTTEEILEAAGMLRPLGDTLRAMIVRRDIPLEEVIAHLDAIGGPSLSEIIDEQRGPKP